MSNDYFGNTLCFFLVNKLNRGHNTQVYIANSIGTAGKLR